MLVILGTVGSGRGRTFSSMGIALIPRPLEYLKW